MTQRPVDTRPGDFPVQQPTERDLPATEQCRGYRSLVGSPTERVSSLGLVERLAEASDAPACAAVLESRPDHFTASAVAEIGGLVAERSVTVAERDGRVVGVCALRRDWRDVVRIEAFAVAASAGGRGIGAWLLARVLDGLRKESVSLVVVTTLDESAGYEPYAATRRFWERHNFRQIDRIDPYPGWDAPGNPAAIYVLALGPHGVPAQPGSGGHTARAAQLVDSYDRLAPVWAEATDDGPFNAHVERPAVRSLIPRPLQGSRVLDAGCAAGSNSAWLLEQGATVMGVDRSPAMVEEAQRRCGASARFVVADLSAPLPFNGGSFDGVVCSLTLHYLRDWSVPLRSFARLLSPEGGWVVISVDHPAGEPFPGEHGGYFDTRLVHDTMTKADVTVPISLWRRSFADSVGAFRAAGFDLDAVVEPRPSAEAVERFPVELGPVADRPWFIVYRLRRPPGPTPAPSSEPA